MAVEDDDWLIITLGKREIRKLLPVFERNSPLLYSADKESNISLPICDPKIAQMRMGIGGFGGIAIGRDSTLC
ncbi:MAG: hypothetical protein MZV64_59155 [Ignavibacteriales bacterium]|nr:hypothetical protein [Ignavibacteriales bacterium]